MNRQLPSSNKISCISYMRITSMLLIIFFHSLCFYAGTWWFLGSEIVPLWKFLAPPVVKTGLIIFVFISGFLYGYLYIKKEKYRNSHSLLINKGRHLLIPYFIWGCFMIFAFPQLKFSWTNLLTGIAHLWFLFMIFWHFLIIVLLEKTIRISKSPLIVDIVVTLISFSFFYLWESHSAHHYFLCLEDTFYYLPSFIVGYYTAKHLPLDNTRNIKKTAIVTSIFLIACLFIASYFNYPTSSTIYRIPTILLAVNSLFLFPNTNSPSKWKKVLNNLDKNSMGIYIFNQIVVFFLLYQATPFFMTHLYSGPFIIFILSFFIPWGFSVLFNSTKYFSWINGK